MATYIVGDLQGCYDELQLLLDKVRFDPAVDMLYLVGDLVARGDKSLQCLTLVKSLGTSAKTVLGNHDLHFIATALGIKKIKARDRVEQIFQSDQLAPLTHWLRQQPLLIHRPDLDFVITHAGISPQWDLATAKACAAEVERELQQGDYYGLMSQMYANQPDYWSPELQGMERLRYIINVFTRMRYCYADGRLDFDCKLPPAQAPTSLQPWFNLANPLYQQTNLLFGHWASLAGVATPSHIYALDTGCVWNNAMTMLRWEDKQYFVQPAIKDYRFTD